MRISKPSNVTVPLGALNHTNFVVPLESKSLSSSGRYSLTLFAFARLPGIIIVFPSIVVKYFMISRAQQRGIDSNAAAIPQLLVPLWATAFSETIMAHGFDFFKLSAASGIPTKTA